MLLKLSYPAYLKLSHFFTYSVPYLQLDVLVVNLYSSCTEFNADGQIMLLSEAFVCELEEEAGLAHT